MPRLDEELLVHAVAERVGDDDHARARRALIAVVDAIASCLPAADEEAWFAALPEPWSSGRTDPTRRGGAIANPFADVARRAGLSEPGAHEYVVVVARAIAERVDAETLARLSRHLTAPWPALLAPPSHEPSEPVAPPHRVRPLGEGRTLASGRPGSRSPMADASAEPAQTGSVVRAGADDPYADSKLSSGAPHSDAVVSAHEKGRRRLSDSDD